MYMQSFEHGYCNVGVLSGPTGNMHNSVTPVHIHMQMLMLIHTLILSHGR